MTFEKLAQLVAADFKETMETEGFSTFKEMRKCYDWDMADVKDEVDTIITELANAEYNRGESGMFFFSDDHTFIQIGVCDEMAWKDFKKLLFAEIGG